MIFATMVFAAFAWQAGLPREPEQGCEEPTVVQYLPIPAVEPVMKKPPLGWPIQDRAIQASAEQAPEPAVAKDDSAEDQPRRRHRKHHRHWRR
jgi:hypothetical protein